VREYVACARPWRLLKQARHNARCTDLEFDYFHGEVVLRPLGQHGLFATAPDRLNADLKEIIG
jgi:hypothetical protein